MGLFKKKYQEPTAISSITAGGSTFTAGQYTDATYVNQLRQHWQSKVFDIYDTEGHLFYAANYIGGAMSKIKLVAAKRQPLDKPLGKPEVLQSGAFSDMVRNINSAKGGQGGFLRQAGRNVFLVGEVWVVASPQAMPDGTSTVRWDAVSVKELESANGNFQRRTYPGAQPRDVTKGSSVFRIWKEHPAWTDLADSAPRSCMELLEKIIILNRAEKAVARSQLAGNGILGLPQELVPPSWQNQDKSANPMESNPLWQSLAESMIAPLHDESSPSAVVPWVVIGPADVLSKITYEPMERKFDTAAASQSIKDAVEQIANTLEIPKEVLLGVGEATHWTAWAIKEDTFEAHIKPLIQLVCDSLTRTFLYNAFKKLSPGEQQQVLKEAGVKSIEDVVVWYDASELVVAPDKADKYAAAHDRIVVTDEAYARETGIPEEDVLKKDSEEYKMRVGVKMADAKMAITGVPTEPPAPAAGGGGSGPKPSAPAGASPRKAQEPKRP